MKNLLPHTIAITLIGAGCVALDVIMSPAAMALSFNFSFTNTANGSGTGVVTGIVEGLTDNATSAATSVRVLSNTEGFGLGEYVGNPDLNIWTVAGGGLQSFDFRSFGSSNTSPAVTDSSLVLISGDVLFSGEFAGLNNRPGPVSSDGREGLVFTPVDATPVPTPSLVPGLLGLGLGMWRKRKGAAAQAV